MVVVKTETMKVLSGTTNPKYQLSQMPTGEILRIQLSHELPTIWLEASHPYKTQVYHVNL